MKAKKTLALVLAFVLVAAVSVAATLAYLTAKSSEVKNTFTVGKISIKLQEHETFGDDGKGTGTPVTVRDNIKMVPGATIPKDPFVTVEANSEDCYVYAKVSNGICDTSTPDSRNYATLNINQNWEIVESNTDQSGFVVTLYRYKNIVNLSETDTVLEPVFDSVTIDSGLDSAVLDKLDGRMITILAYAHQAGAPVTQTIADNAAIAWAWPAPAP